MRDSKEVKLIMIGNVNRGGVDNSDTPTMNKGYPLRLRLGLMDIV